MKICSIHIKEFQQFRDTFLDFTNPETGLPVDKICFIGRNGTGKTTILHLIKSFFKRIYHSFLDGKSGYVFVKFINSDQKFILVGSSQGHSLIFHEEIEQRDVWKTFYENPNQTTLKEIYNYIVDDTNLLFSINLRDNSSDLLIDSPAESFQNQYLQTSEVPKTTVNEALALFKNFPYDHTVSEATISDFWKLLIFFIKHRENERNIFENKPENLNKTKLELIHEFEKIHPKILEKISKLWNKILDSAGLYFDFENANNPIQLNDNLLVYIRLKSTNETINYNQLSSGIRNFIFRIGHIFSLYFNREIKRGFLLLDELENSLYPDFLYELVEIYEQIIIDKNQEKNTQMFISTHNPIIAAQFEPYERIILEWDEEGKVVAHKGKTPVGDDPNDILNQDFGLRNLMGGKGIEMWNKYLELRQLLRDCTDDYEKEKLILQIQKIGKDYNF